MNELTVYQIIQAFGTPVCLIWLFGDILFISNGITHFCLSDDFTMFINVHAHFFSGPKVEIKTPCSVRVHNGFTRLNGDSVCFVKKKLNCILISLILYINKISLICLTVRPLRRALQIAS